MDNGERVTNNMCGICGIVGDEGRDREAVLGRMTDAMRHRGPDDHGIEAAPSGATTASAATGS